MFAQIAQSVEQGTENPRVGSSILSLGTKESRPEWTASFLFNFGRQPAALPAGNIMEWDNITEGDSK